MKTQGAHIKKKKRDRIGKKRLKRTHGNAVKTKGGKQTKKKTQRLSVSTFFPFISKSSDLILATAHQNTVERKPEYLLFSVVSFFFLYVCLTVFKQVRKRLVEGKFEANKQNRELDAKIKKKGNEKERSTLQQKKKREQKKKLSKHFLVSIWGKSNVKHLQGNRLVNKQKKKVLVAALRRSLKRPIGLKKEQHHLLYGRIARVVRTLRHR